MKKDFDSLSDPRFRENFASFRESAFRFEALQVYDVGYEEDSFRRFLGGEPRGANPSIGSWVERVTSGVSLGKLFQRVHVVFEPLSDYLRFECAWSYRDSTAAGEDVRILVAENESWPRELPRIDFWLWDSAILAKLYYSRDGQFLSGELTDNERDVARAVEWRGVAVAMSIPFVEYDGKFDDRMRGLSD